MENYLILVGGSVYLNGTVVAEMRLGRGQSGWQFRRVGAHAPAEAFQFRWQKQRDRRKCAWGKLETMRRIEFVLGYRFTT